MLTLQHLVNSVALLLLSFDITAEGVVGVPNMRGVSSLSALLIVAWTSMLKDVEGSAKQEVEQHLEAGKKLLAAGQFADALTHYHAAVEGDPSNYMTFFRRATVYLAMGRSKSAVPDLNRVLELKPDFTAARLRRGSVRLKSGNLDEAHEDFKEVVAREPENTEAQQHLASLQDLRLSIRLAKQFYANKDYQAAISSVSPVIESCPWDPALRELRAECYIAQGDYFKAIGDIRPTTKLRPDNTAAFYKLSLLNYEMGDAEESLLEIRECLKLDPDHKECFPHYKKVKKLVKQLGSIQEFRNQEKWDECVEKVAQVLKTESEMFAYVHRSHGYLCHCHSKAKNVKEAFDACNLVLEEDENDVEALCDRAEAYIANEQYEKAIDDYRRADEITDDGNHLHRQVQDGMKRAQKLLKQSHKRDYYKILGVRRNAKKPEIVRAYRKLAVQWHPDKHQGEDREEAEKMFINIAAAKEVLTDPEKRAKFDNGEDPLDPEEQAHGQNPFYHQGFNPFGQQGFNFKFHFN